jgi:hypothetical protein
MISAKNHAELLFEDYLRSLPIGGRSLGCIVVGAKSRFAMSFNIVQLPCNTTTVTENGDADIRLIGTGSLRSGGQCAIHDDHGDGAFE